MKIFNIIFILILAVNLAACSTTKYTTVRKSADFDSILSKSITVAIVPAKAEIYSLGAGGGKTKMYEYEDLVENLIPEILAENLRNKGFRTISLNPKDIHVNKLSQSIVLLTENYHQNIDPLYKPQLRTEEESYNVNVFLDSKLPNINDRVNADYLVFFDYHASHRNKGAIVKDVIIASLFNTNGEPDPVTLKIAIIDLKNSQLIWSNWVNVTPEGTPWGLGSFNSSLEVERKRLDHFIKIILSSIPNA